MNFNYKKMISNNTQIENENEENEDIVFEKIIVKKSTKRERRNKPKDDIDGKILSFISKCGDYSSEIKTKLNNINKASVDNSIPCTTKRVSQNSRLYVNYDIIKQNNLSLTQLNTHEKGICIGITWSKYKEMKQNIEILDDLDNYLFNNIGSDNIVSCIVVIIRIDGNSGSTKERLEKDELEQEATLNNWIPLRRKQNVLKTEIHNGNDKWEGHYYYNISGGQKNAMKSCDDQIFTTYKGFMTSNDVINSNYVCLLYMMLHLKDINKIFEQDELNDYLSCFENYLNNVHYLKKSCFELIQELKCFDKNGHLISPILCEEISIDDFSEQNLLNISHNIAVSKNKILFCEDNCILLSDYRPGNLFWDFKLGNMRQQENTIDEYWDSIERCIELRKKIY